MNHPPVNPVVWQVFFQPLCGSTLVYHDSVGCAVKNHVKVHVNGLNEMCLK